MLATKKFLTTTAKICSSNYSSSKIQVSTRLFSFQTKLQERNEDVRLSHMVVNEHVSHEKSMIVLHGLLGSKRNWRGLCRLEGIRDARRCFLVEMRNHSTSDHHREHNYVVMSDDIIRFADHHNLEKFTVMGHSMGARTAMTLACRFPERVDGVISVDAAPKNEQDQHACLIFYAFGSFAEQVLNYMHDLSQNQTVTYRQTVEKAREFFKGKPQFVALVQRSLVSNQQHGENDPVKFAINIETLRREFQNIPYFDESLRFTGPALNIVGGRSRQYEFEVYQKVFPNYVDGVDVVTIEDAGHWVHFDKPLETVELIDQFLKRIDQRQ